MKRFVSAALALCLGISTPALAAAPSFSDVPSSHWAYSFVETASDAGWISGYDDGTFGVDDQVTYAQMATMLVRAFYPDDFAAYSGSTDVWYRSFCEVAAQAGLFAQTDAAVSSYDSVVVLPISRYEMAQILYNALQDKGADLDYTPADVQAGIADWESIPANYQDAVMGAISAGIMSAVDDKGTFGGEGAMTRAQAAVVMTRANEIISGQSPADDNTASDVITAGQQNALDTAKRYLQSSAFSYSGLIDQLEYEKYSTEDATYAADHCGADWNEQALLSAKSYIDYSAFSYTGLIDQLEYEGFTAEQAAYGADNCGADWNAEAAEAAANYLEFSSFSRDGLIDQLLYEGFTQEQAEYGVTQAGL